ncbi:NAD(P)-dependent oxidoreductase [Terasakiella sp. A23]|uniref:NAD-dependent epimerase/dehydratase family protein n=1 Tax=Terasakiella sp. FCG-A23 TaxID=3080561 RepID=UPI002952C5C0|nr:NAD(P)-dependent oxidoreductase [Terasakiella sp. A23]MDV7340822.1 NAD(P)-dependent oxidoreductase [Terasakiella sp. A23]
MRKVIISGVSSFVGMHLAKAFVEAGWGVTALTTKRVNQYDGIRAERLNVLKPLVTFEVCDVTDAQAVATLVEEVKPQLWIQHAGYATNYASADYDLAQSFAVNVTPLKAIYEALNKVGACMILTGSSMEYGSSNEANKEDDPCWPETPYGVSKLAETVEAKRLAALYRVRTRVARLYIPVGTMDAPGKLMDHVITQLKARETVDLSPCSQKRDFLSVEDISSAYLGLAEDMARCEFDIFNICSGQATLLKHLLTSLCLYADQPEELLNFGAFPMRAGEPMISYGDNEKAKSLLNWKPGNLNKVLLELLDD